MAGEYSPPARRVVCPVCGARPGERCFTAGNSRGEGRGQLMVVYHPLREERAKSYGLLGPFGLGVEGG